MRPTSRSARDGHVPELALCRGGFVVVSDPIVVRPSDVESAAGLALGHTDRAGGLERVLQRLARVRSGADQLGGVSTRHGP
jgi:hypothetical protein